MKNMVKITFFIFNLKTNRNNFSQVPFIFTILIFYSANYQNYNHILIHLTNYITIIYNVNFLRIIPQYLLFINILILITEIIINPFLNYEI